VVAAVRAQHPAIRLVQVGGSFTAPQREQIERLHLGEAITQLRGLERRTIAALYRQAQLVLQPSEAEGFGLPVLEALSCGSTVVASDLAMLREVGGPAVLYCPVGAVEAWTETVCRVLADPSTAPDRAARLAQAAKFSWAAQAQTILQGYRNLR
jgi:glycosyltransferase involved in cell wall biosynthesis